MNKKGKDALGDRMKQNFEDRTRFFLPRRSYTIIRCDGKSFHTYVKGLEKPFDMLLIEDMDETAAFLCKNIMGAKLAYVQSDEISIVISDFDDISTEAWFDNNLQKMASISASMATAKFNELRFKRGVTKLAMFDSRVFQIPDRTEVENYLIWRYRDCVKNSISMAAQQYYSPKELHQKNSDQKQELLFQKGINWSKYPEGFKNGRMIVKETYEKETLNNKNSSVLRSRWISHPFDKKFFNIIPNY
jgi:tRNA(His) guanylyltransferase